MGTTAGRSTTAVVVAEEISQGKVHWAIGEQTVELAADFHANGFNFGVVRLEAALVFGAGRCRVHIIIASTLDVVKEHGVFKLKRDFVWIEHLENDQFVSGCGEAGEVFFQLLRRREQIRDEHGHSAFAGKLSGATERFAEVGFFSFGFAFEGEHQLAEVTVAMPGGEEVAHLLVEGEQSDGVTLLVQEPGECRSEGAGVFKFGVTDRAVGHRAALIDEKVAAKVGFVLEFFYVKTVGTGIEPPIEVAGVFALRVGAIFGELDRKAVIRAAMEAVPEAFDDDAGAKFQAANGHEGFRIDEARLRPGSGRRRTGLLWTRHKCSLSGGLLL